MIYFFHGPETFLAYQEIQKILEGHSRKKTLDLKAPTSANRLNAWRTQLLQPSLLGEKQLFVVKNLQKEADASIQNLGLKILQEAKDQSQIVVWEEGQLPARRTKLLKFLLQEAQAKEFKPLGPSRLRMWVKKRADELLPKQLSAPSIEKAAIEEILRYHGSNLWLIESELNKLAAFVKGRTIQVNDVEKLCRSTIEESIFRLADAVGEKNGLKALKIFKRLTGEGVAEGYILIMMARQFRLLALSLVNALQKEHPFVREKVLSQNKNWNLGDLSENYLKLVEMDQQRKKGVDLKVELTLYLGSLGRQIRL